MFRRLSVVANPLARGRGALSLASRPLSGQVTTSTSQTDIFNPTEEHLALRQMLRSFVENEVDPQALEHNRQEKFNVELFRKLGSLGLLGITVEPEFGGSGMDATAAVIAHGNLAYSLMYDYV